MRCLFFLLLFCSLTVGCTDRPEVSPKNYGIILDALPVIEEAEKPFPFPKDGENDHQHCEFDEFDFM